MAENNKKVPKRYGERSLNKTTALQTADNNFLIVKLLRVEIKKMIVFY